MHSRQVNSFLLCMIAASGTMLYYFLFQYRFYEGGISLIFVVAYLLAKTQSFPVSISPMLAFCGFMLLSTTWAPNPADGQAAFVNIVPFILFSLAAPLLLRTGSPGVELRIAQAIAIAYLFISLAAFAQVGSFVDESKGSIRTIIGNTFLISIPAYVYYVVDRRSAASLILLLATVVVGVLSESRTFTLFAVPVGLACFVLYRLRPGNRAATRRTAVVALAAAIVAFGGYKAAQTGTGDSRLGSAGTSFSINQQVLDEIKNPKLADADIERRLSLFMALTSFVNSPATGGGFFSTGYYVEQVSKFKTSAHGWPSTLLGEMGIIGTALFGWLVVTALNGFRRALRAVGASGRPLIYAQLMSFIAVLISGMFHQAYQDVFFYLFAGFGLYYHRRFRVLNGLHSEASTAFRQYGRVRPFSQVVS